MTPSKVLMMNFKSSRVVLWSFPQPRPSSAVWSKVATTKTEHITCGRTGRKRGSGGRTRLCCCLPTNKRSRVVVENGPTGPIIYLSSTTRLPSQCLPPWRLNPPFSPAVFDLPFQFRMDGNVTQQKVKTQKEANKTETLLLLDKHCREQLGHEVMEQDIHLSVRLPFSQCLPSRPMGHSHL